MVNKYFIFHRSCSSIFTTAMWNVLTMNNETQLHKYRYTHTESATAGNVCESEHGHLGIPLAALYILGKFQMS